MTIEVDNGARVALVTTAALLTQIAFGQTAPPAAPPLPTTQAYAKFSWPRQGYILGDTPGTLIFSDTRGDQTELWSDARRGSTGWVYRPGQTTPQIVVVVSLPDNQPYQANGVLDGYDRDRNAYVEVTADAAHKGRLICEVDPAGGVKVVMQLPAGLWKPGSAGPVPVFAKNLGQKASPTKGMILGDERVDKDQKISLSQGKVSWTYNNPDDEPDGIRVVLIEANGNVRSPHADLKGYDTAKNAYVQIDLNVLNESEMEEFNRQYYRIDSSGMPSKVDSLPKDLWLPTSRPNEAKRAPAQPIAPERPVEKLPNGKFRVHFTDPDSNQPTSLEMEQLAASKNPDTPFDGVYHNEKYMITIRGDEIRVSPNRVPMGFMKREQSNK